MEARQLSPHLHAQLQVEVRQRLVHQEGPRIAAPTRGPTPRAVARRPKAAPAGAQQVLDVQEVRNVPTRSSAIRRGSAAPGAARRCSARRSAWGTARSSGRPSRGRARPVSRRVGVEPVEAHLASVGRLESCDDAQRRRLAGPGRARAGRRTTPSATSTLMSRAPGRRRTTSQIACRRVDPAHQATTCPVSWSVDGAAARPMTAVRRPVVRRTGSWAACGRALAARPCRPRRSSRRRAPLGR